MKSLIFSRTQIVWTRKDPKGLNKTGKWRDHEAKFQTLYSFLTMFIAKLRCRVAERERKRAEYTISWMFHR